MILAAGSCARSSKPPGVQMVMIHGEVCRGDELALSKGIDPAFAMKCKEKLAGAVVRLKNFKGETVEIKTDAEGRYQLPEFAVRGGETDEIAFREQTSSGLIMPFLGQEPGPLPAGSYSVSVTLPAAKCRMTKTAAPGG